MKFRQDFYKIKHPEKYIGDVNKIFYRSSYELTAFQFLDNNPNVKKWGSEIIAIPYLKPTADGSFKKANYFPDLYVEYVDRNNNYIKEIFEIKPEKQTKPSSAKRQKVRVAENFTYMVNQMKWDAAQKWCNARGIKFSIIAEKSLFGK
jgi:hypothetical protein